MPTSASRVGAVLDSDESDLEVDLSDAEGDSYSGKEIKR